MTATQAPALPALATVSCLQSPVSRLQSPVTSVAVSCCRRNLLRLIACQLGLIYDFNHFLIAFNVQRFSGQLPLSGQQTGAWGWVGSGEGGDEGNFACWLHLVTRPKLMSLVPLCASWRSMHQRALIADELICTHLAGQLGSSVGRAVGRSGHLWPSMLSHKLLQGIFILICCYCCCCCWFCCSSCRCQRHKFITFHCCRQAEVTVTVTVAVAVAVAVAVHWAGDSVGDGVSDCEWDCDNDSDSDSDIRSQFVTQSQSVSQATKRARKMTKTKRCKCFESVNSNKTQNKATMHGKNMVETPLQDTL